MVNGGEGTPGSWKAFVGGTLIDGTGQDPLPDAVVVVDESVIQDVGRKGEVRKQVRQSATTSLMP